LKKIVHVSDIHFGKADEVVAGELFEKVNELSPDLMIVSGDRTQRARRGQFRRPSISRSVYDAKDHRAG